MASDPMEQILVGMGIDLSPVESAGDKIAEMLAKLNMMSVQLAASTNQAGTAQQTKLTESLALAEELVKVATQAAIAEAQKEKELQRQTDELKKQILERKADTASSQASTAAERTKQATLQAETAEIQKQRVLRQSETAEIQKQTAEIRQQQLLQKQGASGGGTSGFNLGSLVQGLLGGQGLSSAFAGALAGSLIPAIASALYDKVSAVIGLAAATGKMAESQSNVAERTGLSIKEVGIFTQVAENAGISAHAFTSSMRGLSKALSDNTDEGRVAKRAMSELGIVVHDQFGALLPASEMWFRIAEGIGRVPTSAGRADAAMKILNRSGLELLPVLNDSLRTTFTELDKLGVGFSESGAKKALEFDNALDLLDTKMNVLKRQAGELAVAIAGIFVNDKINVDKNGRTSIPGLSQPNYLPDNAPLPSLDLDPLHAFDKQGKGTALTPEQFDAVTKVLRKKQIDEILSNGLQELRLTKELEKEKKAQADAEKEANVEAVAAHHARVEALEDEIKNIKVLPDLRRKLDEQQAQGRLQAGEHYLSYQKQLLAEETTLENNRYKDGEVSLKEHLEKQNALARTSYDYDLQQLNIVAVTREEALNRQRQKISEDLAHQRITPQESALQNQTIGVESAAVRTKYEADKETAAQNLKIRLTRIAEQGDADARNARKNAIDSELRLEENRIQNLERLNRKLYDDGLRGADAYLAAQTDLIERAARLQIEAEQKKHTLFEEKNAATESQLKGSLARIVEQAKQHLQELADTEAQIRAQAAQQYGDRVGGLESRLEFVQSRPGASPSAGRDVVHQIAGTLEAQRAALESALSVATPYSATWNRIYQSIEGVYFRQVKYNDELRKMNDVLIPISSLFDTIGRSIQQNFHSGFAQNLAQQVQAGAQILQKSSELGRIIRGDVTGAKDPAIARLEVAASGVFKKAENSATSLVAPFHSLAGAAADATTRLEKLAGINTEESGTPNFSTDVSAEGGTSEASDKIQIFVSKTVAAIQALDGFANSILGAKSAISGGIGGALGGAGLGNTISTALGFTGPIGSIVGAIGGGIAGIITGSKNAKVQRQIDRMNEQYKALMNDFAVNTNNLQGTINQLQSLITSARQQQANSKKGNDKFQQVIDQYSDQLRQLENQQRQLIRNLDEQLAILTAPEGSRELLSNLSSILKQYQQFEGAAKSVEDLANAHLFLTESLNQYEDNLSHQLAQDNEQAIQDALQLNDLLTQRTDLYRNFDNQIQSVLTQGVLVRQPTRAQTAGQQIATLKTDYDRQKQTLDAQIAATTYKVDVERRVFDIATTRIGLETQLLALQNRQADLDIQRISALRDLVAQLRSGDFSSGALGALLGAIPGITGGPNNIGNTLNGTPTTPSGPPTAQDLFAEAYQERAAMGYGDFRAQNF